MIILGERENGRYEVAVNLEATVKTGVDACAQ